MKPGTRVLGIAESFGDETTSSLGGVVMTLAGRVDDVVLGRCTVGGSDVTESVIEMVDRLDREDVRYVLIAGVALAWYNIVDLNRVAATVDRPAIAVTFEESEGLEDAIREHLEADEVVSDRLDRYAQLPSRRALSVDGGSLYVRQVGCGDEEADELVVRCTEPAVGRPEPLRVAQLVARAFDTYRTTTDI